MSVVTQENLGQLSAFNSAIKYIPEDSQVFFIDADDVYAHDYVELVMKSIGNRVADFTFCDVLYADSQSVRQFTTARKNSMPTQVFEKTSALTRSREYWIGKETSALSISEKALKMILPYPCEQEWKTRADDVLIFASSIIGLWKVYIPSVQVLYRVHESNNFYRKKLTDDDCARKNRNNKILFKWYCDKYLLNFKPGPFEIYNELKRLTGEQKNYLQLPSKYKIYRRVLRQFLIYKFTRKSEIKF